jgi:hypothetical protein
MRQISLKQGIGIFVLVFILPAIVLVPMRTEIMAIVPLAEPTLWQSLNNLVGSAIIIGLAVFAWNQRKRIQQLEREVERQKYYREQDALTDGGTRDE